MRYQYKREPLTTDEATRLANACNAAEAKLVVWTLLDTGLRVSELANLKRANLDCQTHRLMIYGKGGLFGSKSKRRVIPLTARIRPLRAPIMDVPIGSPVYLSQSRTLSLSMLPDP
jgi:integrase/recombinase XerD